MSVTHQINLSVSSSSGVVSLNGYDNETGNTEIILNSNFPAASVNTAFSLALTAANLQDVFLWSDKGGTIKTNGNATAEIQTITITGTPTGGTFALGFQGQITAPIAFNASAANVQTALQALSTIGSSNITCTGAGLPGAAVVCTFAAALAPGLQPLMTYNIAGLTGGAPAITIVRTTPGQPSNSIILTPGVPLVWGASTGYGSNPFTTNVTTASFSCTPASRLQGRILSA